MKMKKIEIYKKELERIKNNKRKLTAEIVVEEARDKNNPLHDYFNWNNNEAGKKWRLHQARVLINMVKYELITPEGQKKEVCAYEIIKTNHIKEYKSIYEILSNQKWKKQVMNQAVREISYWRKKYEIYAEFKPLIREIKRIERRYLKDGKRKPKNRAVTPKKKRN